LVSKLSVRVAGLHLEHPVMNASGILGATPEHIERLASYGFSAIVTKTITPQPREGNPPPIIVEIPNIGLLNAVGLANPGKNIVPKLVEVSKRLGKPIVISVGGSTPSEFLEVASIAEEAGADAIELNLSCPHAKGYGIEIGSDPYQSYEVVKTVANSVKIPTIAKLGLCDRIVEVASKVLEAGAKGLTLINTVRAMVIDVMTARPVLSNVFGGLSGPAIHPIAVRVVYEVYRELRPEIIGCGGVVDWVTAAELILAGARAVQVGTALMWKENIVYDVLIGLRRLIEHFGVRSIEDLVGYSHRV